MTVSYRMAQVDDLPALALLRWEMEAERKHTTMDLDAYTRAYGDALREDVERGSNVSWLAEDGGQPVACVSLIWWNLAPNFVDAHRARLRLQRLHPARLPPPGHLARTNDHADRLGT